MSFPVRNVKKNGRPKSSVLLCMRYWELAADVVDVDAVNCAETNPVNLPAVDIVIAAAIDCAVQFATCVGYARTLGTLPYNLLNSEEMVA